MDERTMKPSEQPEASNDRLPYRAPELREHGTVRELTLGAGDTPDPADAAPNYSTDATPPLS
ncbi:MAG TPA: lasso RiPP family leader peptide-containing protein [Gemmatimonadaceae bacterium]|nr:lasso RiPP family leader peptide-containing protein [Gemmatimonadaceae bacterium]